MTKCQCMGLMTILIETLYLRMKNNFNDMFSPSGAEVSIIPVLQGDVTMKVDDAQLPDSLPILAVGGTICTHVGPGAIALAFFSNMN